jgi:nicotinamidase-related amidase
METRRSFLSILVRSGACAGLVAKATSAQTPVIHPPSQNPAPGQPPTSESEGPPLPSPDKKILESNDKDMKKKVEELYELAKELKDEVEKTDSSKVLSLNLVRKAEEIEKLAHDIKNRSKG